MKFALRARYVFPVDRPAIENGVVTIEDGRIADLGKNSDVSQVIDLGDVALLPGFVNCHTHLEFSDRNKPLGKPGIRLVDWIRLVIAERGRSVSVPDQVFAKGLHESLSYGVTTIGEISQGAASIERECFGESSPSLTYYLEVIGFSRARADSAYAATLEKLETLAANVTGRIGISPHAPYTVSPGLISRLMALAIEREMPVAMHLAESAEELQLLETGGGPFQELLDERSMWDPEAIPRGTRPLDYLREIAKAPRSLVIHGNYLADEEHDFLAANRERMSLVFCPRTHAYFQHPPYPLVELLKKNVRVVLGTDSRASNPDLNLLDEMRTVVRLAPQVHPDVILRMGTLDGAEGLGNRAVGSLSPGKRADLVAIPVAGASGTPEEALEAILTGSELPNQVWCGGYSRML